MKRTLEVHLNNGSKRYQDDFCEKNFLEELIPAFDDPDVKLAYCQSLIVDESDRVIGNYLETDYLKSLSPTKWKAPYCNPANKEIEDGLGVKNTILNISSVLFRKFDYSDEFIKTLTSMKFAGDWYLILNCIKDGKVYYSPKPLNYHRRHSRSVIGKLLNGKDEGMIRKFFEEYQIVVDFVLRNYRPSPQLRRNVYEYVCELWEQITGRQREELKEYFRI
ncbi:hypothetical protein AFULGI_00003030 [Archaeoglobus fulgidus DSM 8774]|uniref:Uncharacterized protein n=1 Tax=Archaeoglobus fulgidus DSM 8774 TaxID=1344584 RepID=A0A075WD92_ARCFL|nr:hypothetical protein AFULGI_00003030 [Archaeoglobus fulgidus DSM 8774]